MVLKDAHMTEVALLKSHPIASLDDKQRRALQRLAVHYALLSRVEWFNPVRDDGWSAWVEAGMPSGAFDCRLDAD